MQRVDPGIVIVLKEVQSCNFCIYSGTISFLDAFLPDGDVRSHNRSPKVGDTLEATVTGAAAASYQWYADDEEIEGADEATLLVTEDMVGKIISVKATAEDMEEATATCTEAVGVYEALEILSAEQVKKDQVYVTFSAPISEADKITVTKGSADKTVSAVLPDDDNLGATLTMKDALATGTYTVTLTPADTKVDPSSVEFDAKVANKAARVEILGDYLVMKDTNFQEGYCFIKGYNEFDEPITLSGLTVTAAPSDSTQYDASTGKLTVKSNTTNQYAIIKQVTVYAQAMVDSKPVMDQKTLEVANIGYPAEVEFGEITKDSTTVPDISEGITINELNSGLYYIPILSVKDNYGNDMLAKDLNDLNDKNLLTTVPTGDTSLYFSVRKKGSVFTEKNGQIVVFLEKGNGKPGKFNFLMTSAGGQFDKEVNIIENPFIDTLDVTLPDIYEYEETEEFGLVGHDQDGKELDLYDYLQAGEYPGRLPFFDQQSLTESNTYIDAGDNGTWRVQKFADTKTYKVTFVPKETVKSKSVITFVSTTASFKTRTLIATVGARGTSGYIGTELKSGTASGEYDFNQNLKFFDANGKEMDRAHNAKYPTFVPAGRTVTATLDKDAVKNLTDEKIAEANHDNPNRIADFEFYYVVSNADKAVTTGVSETVKQIDGCGDNDGKVGPGQYYVFLIASQNLNDLAKTRIIDSRAFYVSKEQVGDVPVSYTAKVSNKLYTGDKYADDVEVKVDITYRNGVVVKDQPASGLSLDGGFKVTNKNIISKGTATGDGTATVSVYLDKVDGLDEKGEPWTYTNDGAVATCTLTYSDDDPVGTSIDFKRETQNNKYGTNWKENETETVWDLKENQNSAITVEDGKLTMTNGNVAGDEYTVTVKDQYGEKMPDAKYYINGTQVPTAQTTIKPDDAAAKVLEIKAQSKGSEVSQTWRVNVPKETEVTAVDNTEIHNVGRSYNVKTPAELNIALDLAKADPAENTITITDSMDMNGFAGDGTNTGVLTAGDRLVIAEDAIVYNTGADGQKLVIGPDSVFEINGYFVDADSKTVNTNNLLVDLKGALTGTGHYDAWNLTLDGTAAKPAIVTILGTTLEFLAQPTVSGPVIISGNIAVKTNINLSTANVAVRGATITLAGGAAIQLPAAAAFGTETAPVATTATIVDDGQAYAVDNSAAKADKVTIKDDAANQGMITAQSSTGGTKITTPENGVFTTTTTEQKVVAGTEVKTVSEFKSAAKEGGALTLGADITLDEDVVLYKDLKINMNGKKIATSTDKELWVSNCTLTLAGSATGSAVTGSGQAITVMSTEAGGLGKLVVLEAVDVSKVGSYWFVLMTDKKPVVSATGSGIVGAGTASAFTPDSYDAAGWGSIQPIDWTISGKTWKTTGSVDTQKTDVDHAMIRYRADFTSVSGT